MNDPMTQGPEAAKALDPIFSQEPPPRPAIAVPDALGLEAFQPHMAPNGFDTFVTLMHYMIHLQQVFSGEEMEWGDDKMAIAAAPFVGFGNPVMWENAYRIPMRERILPLIMRWHRKGKVWQKKNPIPGLFLEHIACDFAQTTRGVEHARAIEDILQDEDFRKKWRMTE